MPGPGRPVEFAPDAVALIDLHASFQQHEHAGTGPARFEQQFTGFPVTHFAEPAQAIDFRGRERGIHLVRAGGERRKRRIGDDRLLLPFSFLSRKH